MRLIPFNQSFEGKEDKNLKAKLLDELPGILNWALQGLCKWQETGLPIPDCIRAATEEYQRESDVLGQWLDEKTELDTKSIISATDLYKDYKSWIDENGHFPYSQSTFGRSLAERGFKKERKTSGWFYRGIRLNNHSSPPLFSDSINDE